jgi:arsenate reductase
MTVKIYGIRNCDTMKKAFAWLDTHRVQYEFHDYKKAGVPAGKLKEWAKKAGWQNLANTRGTTWRKLEPVDVNEKSTLALLEQNTSAIRRPVVEAGARLLIGFDAAEFSAALK